MKADFKLTVDRVKEIIKEYKLCTFIVTAGSIPCSTKKVNNKKIEEAKSFIAYIDLILNSMNKTESQLIINQLIENKSWTSNNYSKSSFYRHFLQAVSHFLDLYSTSNKLFVL